MVKKTFDEFKGSMTKDQKDLLQKQYDHSRKEEGEQRPFDDWSRASGMPALFRGYAFQQWPQEFNDKVYTKEQKLGFDKMMDYLRGTADNNATLLGPSSAGDEKRRIIEYLGRP